MKSKAPPAWEGVITLDKNQQEGIRMIHHISHIDLDGYACSRLVLMDSSFKELLVQTNVNYDKLTQHLESVLSSVKPTTPLSRLIITDLNLKTGDIDVLLKYQDRFRHLVLIDHHQNSPHDLERLRSAVECDLIIDVGDSATKLTCTYLFGNLLEQNDTVVGGLLALINTYDMYLVENKRVFPFAYVLNDWFMDIVTKARDVLTDYGVRELTDYLFRSLTFEGLGLIEDPLSGYGLEHFYQDLMAVVSEDSVLDMGVVTQCITQEVAKMTDPVVAHSAYPQRLDALLAAMAIGPHGKANTYITKENGISLLLSPIKLPRGILYQLMYTLEVVHIHVILSDAEKGRVEFRQHKLKPNVDLSKIAGNWGGGGHIGAAGCHISEPWDEFVPKLNSLLQTHVTQR